MSAHHLDTQAALEGTPVPKTFIESAQAKAQQQKIEAAMPAERLLFATLVAGILASPQSPKLTDPQVLELAHGYRADVETLALTHVMGRMGLTGDGK